VKGATFLACLALLTGCGAATGEPAAMSDRPRSPLEAAKREVPITMYMTTWCPVCRRASAYLASRGYDVRELDVERDIRAAAAMIYVNPRGAVPMFEVDGRYAIGFSAPGIEKLVTAVAREKLAEASRPPRPSNSPDPGVSSPR